VTVRLSCRTRLPTNGHLKHPPQRSHYDARFHPPMPKGSGVRIRLHHGVWPGRGPTEAFGRGVVLGCPAVRRITSILARARLRKPRASTSRSSRIRASLPPVQISERNQASVLLIRLVASGPPRLTGSDSRSRGARAAGPSAPTNRGSPHRYRQHVRLPTSYGSACRELAPACDLDPPSPTARSIDGASGSRRP
jgi:hypothetical protein